MIKFVLQSDQYQREDGFYFDDLTVSVISPSTGNTPTESNTLSDQLVVYPNPVSEKLFLKYSTSTTDNLSAVIYNAVGKSVARHHLSPLVGQAGISVGELKPGLYFVALKSGDITLSVKKFLVE
jgi:hypothetical protein